MTVKNEHKKQNIAAIIQICTKINILTYFHFQEIGVLRQQILSCEGELRTVSSPAYTAKDRDKALAEQSVSKISSAFLT